MASSDEQTCILCHVSGHVQGVYFRASTHAEAESLGVRGYAKNLANGDVEVLACGPQTALVQLRTWLQQGPPAARVDTVACDVAEDAGYRSFHVI